MFWPPSFSTIGTGQALNTAWNLESLGRITVSLLSGAETERTTGTEWIFLLLKVRTWIRKCIAAADCD
jgi:hypothetical protein